jgi:hypothetical protein
MDGSQLQRLTDIAVDVVQPDGNGFALSGQGSDGAEYRLAPGPVGVDPVAPDPGGAPAT